jgi:hypothetical protein
LIATPVAYSLLDDLKATSRWRRFATVTGEAFGSFVGRLRKPRKEAALSPVTESRARDEDEKRVQAGVSGD